MPLVVDLPSVRFRLLGLSTLISPTMEYPAFSLLTFTNSTLSSTLACPFRTLARSEDARCLAGLSYQLLHPQLSLLLLLPVKQRLPRHIQNIGSECGRAGGRLPLLQPFWQMHQQSKSRLSGINERYRCWWVDFSDASARWSSYWRCGYLWSNGTNRQLFTLVETKQISSTGKSDSKLMKI